jgi:hypothetical protein
LFFRKFRSVFFRLVSGILNLEKVILSPLSGIKVGFGA